MTRKRTLWNRNRLHVWVSITDGGRLQFAGQDLNGFIGSDEYEYWVCVPADDIPVVIATLGGSAGDDVLDLLVAHAEEIVTMGESRWLKSLGLEPEISVWT